MTIDVCIIGSGPAGAVLASQLAPTGKKIVIIEAGPWRDREEMNRRIDEGGLDGFMFADVPAHLRVPVSIDTNANWMFWQTRKVGGNSLNWAGLCPRPLENQFKPRSLYGIGEDWPLTYDELEPFYCDAETELGVGGVHDPSKRPRRSRP